MSPEEDRTRDAVDSEPKHYQLSYSEKKKKKKKNYIYIYIYIYSGVHVYVGIIYVGFRLYVGWPPWMESVPSLYD